jgi:acyl-CoA synthetase (AMP-forming)/AMP-acid ligase II
MNTLRELNYSVKRIIWGSIYLDCCLNTGEFSVNFFIKGVGKLPASSIELMRLLSKQIIENLACISCVNLESYIHFNNEELSYSGLIERALIYTEKYKSCEIPAQGLIVIINKEAISAISAFLGAILGGFVPAFLSPKTSKQDPKIYFATLTELIDCHDVDAIVSGSGEALPLGIHSTIISINVLDDFKAYSPSMLSGISLGQQDEHDIAFIQFSSGTTGLRKAIPISHREFFDHLGSFQTAFNYDKSEHVVSWLPLYHDMGLIACCLLPIVTQVPITMIDPEEWSAKPVKLFEMIQIKKATRVFLPNFAFNHLVYSCPENAQFDLSSLKSIVNCSEACRGTSFDMFLKSFSRFGLKREMLKTCYAMAETVFAVSYSVDGLVQRIPSDVLSSQCDDYILPVGVSDFLSSGRPLKNVSFRILDKGLIEQDMGILGQIALKGKTVISNYVLGKNKVEAPVSDGFFLTGDLGLVYDGQLYVLGRIKDTLILNGKNIFAGDVEAVVNQIVGVKKGRVLALSVGCELKGTDEMCVLLENENEIYEVAGLKKSVRMMVSDHFGLACRVDVLPTGFLLKTSSGKLSRSLNYDKYVKWKAGMVFVNE